MAARKTPAKPEAVAVSTVCSVCGIDWNRHGANPTTDDCIRLLKQELASRPTTVPAPYPVPYPYPAPVPRRPWYGETTQPWSTLPKITCGEGNSTLMTPASSSMQCKAISGLSL